MLALLSSLNHILVKYRGLIKKQATQDPYALLKGRFTLGSRTKETLNWNEIHFKVWEVEWLMGLKVHEDGVKRANFLQWWSAVASVR
jgi:hypothetical protein